LTPVGQDFAPSLYGIAYPKQWLYGKDLNVMILSLRESCVLDNLKREWFGKMFAKIHRRLIRPPESVFN
jgi:hypothetical protein